jgi:hypothetical protein
MPPGNHLISGALATDGKLKARLHAACAAYYETEPFVLSDGQAVVSAGEPDAAPAVASHEVAPQAE